MANVVCSPIRAWRLFRHLVVGLIGVGAIATSAAAQTTVTLSTPGTHLTADMTIRGGAYELTDYSQDPALVSKISGADYTRRILLKFDTENYLPDNAVIQSAYLYLVLKAAEDGGDRPLTAYHVTKSFIENDTNWRYHRPGQAWTTEGGDLGVKFTTTYVGTSVGTAYKFDLTDMVRRTVKGEFGSRYTRLALVDTGSSGKTLREFHSSEASTSSQRPKLVVTYTTGTSSSTAPPPEPAPAPTTTGSTLRVMQWNVQKTKGSDGVCNPDRVATVIVAQKPDVVSLNEVNFYSGSCAWTFDMGEKLRSLVQSKTGQTWYKKHVNVYGGDKGYGNVLLSRFPLANSSSKLLSYDRGVAHMGIYINGRLVNFFSTHVEYYTASWRPIQIREAVNWMATFSEPRIMMGDFNTWPGTSDYNIIATPYQDAWVAAQKLGTATSYNGTGATHGASRFDSVFFSRVSALTLQSVKVVSPVVGSAKASDHDPVVAVFTVR